MLFEHQVKAWRFKSTKVDQFGIQDESYDNPEVQYNEKTTNPATGARTNVIS